MEKTELQNTPANRPWLGGTQRLYGASKAETLFAARVCVIGIGGVGSWTAEALARTGIGHLTLVDMDEICTSNVNRQVHATTHSVGQTKVEAMAARIRLIHPEARVDEKFCFFQQKTCAEILDPAPDVVVDCIDSIPHKCLLIAECRARNIPVVTVGAAGGRRDPTRIQIADLSRTFDDALLQRVRKKLRQKYDFPRNTRKKWRIPAVFSPEPVVYPQSDGSVCAQRESDSNLRLDCASGYGTTGFVTGSFGFAAAAAAVDCILSSDAL